MTEHQRFGEYFSFLTGKREQKSVPKSSALWLMVILVIFCLIHLWSQGKIGIGLDFYQFWAVGQAVSTMEVDNIYSDEARTEIGAEIGKRALKYPQDKRYQKVAKHRKVLETYSTPFLYTVLSLFHNAQYEIAYQTYILFCIVCSTLAIILLCYLLSYSILSTLSFLAILTFMFEPLLFDLQVGNVNQFQLMHIALFAWVRSWKTSQIRDLAGGLILGLTVMFKPNTILVVVLLLISWSAYRRFKQILITILGIIISFLIAIGSSAWFFGSLHCWFEWIEAIKNLPDEIITLSMGNFSLIMVLTSRFGPLMTIMSTISLIVLTVIFIWLILDSNFRREGYIDSDFEWYLDMHMVGLGCMLYLISARLSWLSYFLLTIPMIFLTFRNSFFLGFHSHSMLYTHRLLIIASIVFLAARPVVTILGINQAYPYLIWAGAIILFGIGLNDLRRLPASSRFNYRQ